MTLSFINPKRLSFASSVIDVDCGFFFLSTKDVTDSAMWGVRSLMGFLIFLILGMC